MIALLACLMLLLNFLNVHLAAFTPFKEASAPLAAISVERRETMPKRVTKTKKG